MILIIDDESAVRSSLSFMLKRACYLDDGMGKYSIGCAGYASRGI